MATASTLSADRARSDRAAVVAHRTAKAPAVSPTAIFDPLALNLVPPLKPLVSLEPFRAKRGRTRHIKAGWARGVSSGSLSASGKPLPPRVRRPAPGEKSLKSFRSGFSLIEALVVLAISGMALAIIFTIGTKAGDTGFGLGRRAMAASDSDIAIGDLRGLIRSVALRPSSTFADIDTPVSGGRNRLAADVVMERANQCGPLGWAGQLVLSIDSVGGRSQLMCERGGRKILLIDLGTGPAAFSYSRDGRSWSETYTNAPQDGEDATELHSETVWIRLSSSTFGDVVESASSGSPQSWLRLTDDF